ncbi:MAG: MFS transporter [Phycisphaerales bacterium]|nr:MFS transporter [Phycisphaerales bacterium]
MPAATDTQLSAGTQPTPLWAVNLFSFLNSFGTGVITTGIYLVTKNTYDFSRSMNYTLGVVTGITYVFSTLATGPVLARLKKRGIPLTGTRTMYTLMLLLAAACVLPIAGMKLQNLGPGQTPSSWPIWLLVLTYIPLTGILWPLVESYVSGGRHGEQLRSSMGTWNFVWSGATAVAFWTAAPLIESNAPLMILLLGGVHLLAAIALPWFTPEPARHEDDHEPHPPIYDKLLVTFRILLPTSYIFHTALQPFLPNAMSDLGLTISWQPIVLSVFAVARAATFFTAGRIHAWHGRWSAPIIGGALMFAGFAAALLSPLAATTERSTIGITVLVAGLAVFGIGMAIIYTAAIYYAMAVGKAEVNAGGMHEALIGVGYTVGPLCGLAPSLAIDAGKIAERGFEPFVLLSVGVIGVVAAGLVIQRVVKHA